MTKLEVAAWGVVLALLGAEVGLAVLRPWDHHVALSLSDTHAVVTPSASGTCPDVAVRTIEQPHAIPRSAWVHASDGVNLRSAPSSSAIRLTTLVTGTQLSLQGEQTNPDGSTWYRVRLSDGRDGWLSGRYTTNYPISPASTDSLKIWLPAGYQFQSVAPGRAEAHYKDGPLTLLYVESGPKDQAPPETTPGVACHMPDATGPATVADAAPDAAPGMACQMPDATGPGTTLPDATTPARPEAETDATGPTTVAAAEPVATPASACHMPDATGPTTVPAATPDATPAGAAAVMLALGPTTVALPDATPAVACQMPDATGPGTTLPDATTPDRALAEIVANGPTTAAVPDATPAAADTVTVPLGPATTAAPVATPARPLAETVATGPTTVAGGTGRSAARIAVRETS